MTSLKLTMLGQVGLLLETETNQLLFDPYLSNSVAEEFGIELNRMVEAPFTGRTAPQIDTLFLTHAHLDHTDPATLTPLLAAQPNIQVFAPYESREVLSRIGFPTAKIPSNSWTALSPNISFRTVPAAHTRVERRADGELRDVGYLLRVGEYTIYHAGDTIPDPEIFVAIANEKIDIALLPVNERNFYRDAKGIIGNMTLREAFQFATDLKVKTLIPTHWDMFEPNRVFPEEIELLYSLLKPPFKLEILHAGQTLEA